MAGVHGVRGDSARDSGRVCQRTNTNMSDKTNQAGGIELINTSAFFITNWD
jgi:hypothetical protein